MAEALSKTPEDQTSGDDVKTDEELWQELDAADNVSPGEEEETFTTVGEEADEEGDEEAADGEPEIPEDDTEGSDETPEETDDLDPVALAEQNARLEKQFKSEQNRAIGQQRRADRLQAKLDELEAKQQQAADAGDTSSEDELREKRKAVQEEYGDVVGPLFDELDRLQQKVTDLSSQEAQRLDEVKAEIADIEAAEMAKFQGEHADGFKVVSDNADVFRSWIDDQPKVYRDIYERNRARMVDGTGVALLVSRFKSALHEAQQDEVDEQRTETRLTTRRQKQLEGAASTSRRQRTTTVVSDAPGSDASPEDDWQYWERMDKKKA